ncbi:MAG: hypothetical protein COT85_01415 [Chlamydiae bacterium CG10_big_fil_rev_8_21_14_0_10_42_34]|nr:MAG: hypothetical protein COT85_01415 [Chlamydiae bacterium CG10_big_fil_rev_8_21_14_0_10_42_34]
MSISVGNKCKILLEGAEETRIIDFDARGTDPLRRRTYEFLINKTTERGLTYLIALSQIDKDLPIIYRDAKTFFKVVSNQRDIYLENTSPKASPPIHCFSIDPRSWEFKHHCTLDVKNKVHRSFMSLLGKASTPEQYCELGKVYGEDVETSGLHFEDAQIESFKWFEKAAQGEHADAQYHLAKLYAEGRGTRQDFKQAFSWFARAANKGHEKAQYELGCLYRDGKGTQQNLDKALEAFYSLVAQQYSPAQTALARMYWKGVGVEKDENLSITLYGLAVDRNYAPAQYELAEIFKGKSENQGCVVKALHLYQLSAKQNFAKAQYALGRIYEGLKNVKKAKTYYLAAAKQGHAPSQFALADSYLRKSESKLAAKWFNRAARQNYKPALMAMVSLCETGLGVQKNLDRAIGWCQLAVDQKYPGSDEKLKELMKKLNTQYKEQISSPPQE